MKKIFVQATIFFAFILAATCKKDTLETKLSSQKTDSATLISVLQPYDCSNLIRGVTTSDKDVLIAQNISYSNGTYIPDVEPLNDGKGTCTLYRKDTVLNGTGTLVYDVFYLDPSRFIYNRLPPAILFFHPGGFSDCSSKNETGVRTYCREFAKRGFIVFNIEYRRGRVSDRRSDKNGNKPFAASQMLAMYRAFQDARGAVKSIITMNGRIPAYKFDQNNIFVGGTSAGSYIALSLGYYKTQKIIDEIFPHVSEVLGSIDQDFYIGSPSVTYTIKGVMDCWGGLLTPATKPADKFFVDKIYLPVIAFGGNNDKLIPTNISDIYPSTPPLNRDSLGLPCTFVLPNDIAKISTEYGPTGFYEVMKNKLHIPAELYIDCKMRHGLKSTSGFGTGLTNEDSVRTYQVQRTATFFQTIMHSTESLLITTKFMDCENFRNGCDAADNNNHCSNTDVCK